MSSRKLCPIEIGVIQHFNAHSGVRLLNEATAEKADVVETRDKEPNSVFTHISKCEATKCTTAPARFVWDELGATVNGNTQVGFLVFVQDGYLSGIEGFTYGDPWPESIEEYEFYTVP